MLLVSSCWLLVSTCFLVHNINHGDESLGASSSLFLRLFLKLAKGTALNCDVYIAMHKLQSMINWLADTGIVIGWGYVGGC